MEPKPVRPLPPRDDLYRAFNPTRGFELRSAGDGGGAPTLLGHFAVFNEWTEIDSLWEGNFMERFVPGAFAKTIKESRERMQILFQHGRDPQVGDKPIADISELREDDTGAYYEAELFEGLPPLVVAGLERGKYGASMRFGVMKEEFVAKPGRSDHNPDGIPERTVQEAYVREFGPVTFPAYPNATASIRSLTDEFHLVELLLKDPERARQLLAFVPPSVAAAALSGAGAGTASHSSGESRTSSPFEPLVFRPNPNKRSVQP